MHLDTQDEGPVVRNMADIAANDGRRVTLYGQYRAIPAPTRGGNEPGDPIEYAIVVLDDGVAVYLESFNTPQAVRPPEESKRLDQKQVAASGTIHRVMPMRGEGLMEPSLNDIHAIVERTTA